MTQNRFWSGGPSNPCGPPAPNPGYGLTDPLNVAWNGSYAASGGIGNGWTIGEPRTDGITDGVNTIQGVRAYDPTAGQWTTPDAYAGSVRDPMSQKAYMWNRNNSTAYSDPSGYDSLQVGFWVGVRFGILIWHVWAALEDDNGKIIRVYSYGPAGKFPNVALNKDFGLGQAFTDYVSHHNLLTVPGSVCSGKCSWEDRFNHFYEAWPDNTVQYGVGQLPGSNLSGSAMSQNFQYAGLSTKLPDGSPFPVGGWDFPSGWNGPIPAATERDSSSQKSGSADSSCGLSCTSASEELQDFSHQGETWIQ